MPRNSDSDMCRERPSIASMQSDTGFDEHGRLRGVSDLNRYFADLRRTASNSWSFSAKERKRRWRILRKPDSQIRWRDKSSAVGRAAGGWFFLVICDGTRNCRAAVFRKSRFFSIEMATALDRMLLNAVTTCQKGIVRTGPYGCVQMHHARAIPRTCALA